MKTAYFHCFAGASGDMLLGSLIDAGCDLEILISQLESLNVKGWSLSAEKKIKNSISGTGLNIAIDEQNAHRHLKDIISIIESGSLSPWVKKNTIDIFSKLAEVEASIHGTTIDNIHFHEVGAVDSILDITGFVIALEILDIKKIIASPVHVGSGFVNTMHGKIPVPAPATLKLLENVPVYSTDIKGELTTPTGAVLLKHFASSFGPIPPLNIKKSGYGCGTKDFDIPNMLRVIIGETEESINKDNDLLEDTVLFIETNIDDMNPEHIGYLQELLFKKGALDVWLTPIFMKKNRPGTLISILCSFEKESIIIETLFKNSSSSGIRISQQKRKKLRRQMKTVDTKFGEIEVKIHSINGEEITVSPEYESCKTAALTYNVSIQNVYDEAKNQITMN